MKIALVGQADGWLISLLQKEWPKSFLIPVTTNEELAPAVTEEQLNLVVITPRTWANKPKLIEGVRSHSDVPIVVLFEPDFPQMLKIICLDRGADAVIPVAEDHEIILAKTRAVLRRCQPAWPNIRLMRIGGIQIDFLEKTARVDGNLVRFSPKEFVLLALLAKNAGKVVPREHLASRVWPCPPRLYIRYLRRKLGNKRITAVRGVGYKLQT